MLSPVEIFSAHKGARDWVFKEILCRFNADPMHICQIGAIQNFRADYRAHSGWSDGFFLERIREFGGALTIVDVDGSALSCSEAFMQDFMESKNIKSLSTRYILGDGAQHLAKNNYDLVYLDGSDDPDEMLAQFNAVDRKKCSILCDDWNIKGKKVIEILPENSFEYFDVVHGMAFLPAENFLWS